MERIVSSVTCGEKIVDCNEETFWLFRQLRQFCYYKFHTIAFLIKNHGGKSINNMMMFEKLKIAFGESNEINGAKNCLHLIRSEKKLYV